MPTAKDPSDKFALLGHNEISIEEGTAAEAELFQQIETYATREVALLQDVKETRYRLFVLAASLRKRYLNPKTNKYDQAFHDWYSAKERNLNRYFKTFSNFTKYAAAGDLVNFVATRSKTPEADLEKLPSSRRTLSELSQVKDNLLAEKQERIFWALFVSTPRRKSLTDRDIKFDKTPLIHGEQMVGNEIQSATTEEDIIDWRDAWNNPSSATKLDQARKKKISVPVAIIYVHKTIYDFHQRTGEHKGEVDLDDLTRLMREVGSSFTTRNSNKFRIETNMDTIMERYKKREKRVNPARKILAAKKQKPKK